MKIAYLVHRFPYRTETFVVREMYWLRRSGVDLTIFSLLPAEELADSDQLAELVHLRRYEHGWSRGTWKAHKHFLRARPRAYVHALRNLFLQTFREPTVLARALVLFPRAVRIAHQIEMEGIEHVHAHFVWLEGIAAGVVKDLVGIGFSVRPHAFGLFGRNRKDVAVQLERADCIVTISEYNRQFIRGLSPRLSKAPIEVVHCGVEPDRYKPRPSRNGDVTRIVSVGRAVEKKGHEYLIEACYLLKERNVDFRCVIVTGGTDSRPSLEQLVDERGLRGEVEFKGSMAPAEIISLYHESDIFALACVVASNGDRDGIPVSLMEAMACELPVVATHVSGIPELVHDGQNGLLVDERDPRALAGAIARLATNSSLRSELGRNGRRTILELFDSRRGAMGLSSILNRMA